MTITLPHDLEARVQAAVDRGRFATVADAMAEAARLLLRELDRGRQDASPERTSDVGPDLFLGCLRDSADELDEIVADAYRKRSEDKWRDVDVD